jgi:hypothetical protein
MLRRALSAVTQFMNNEIYAVSLLWSPLNSMSAMLSCIVLCMFTKNERIVSFEWCCFLNEFE